MINHNDKSWVFGYADPLDQTRIEEEGSLNEDNPLVMFIRWATGWFS